MKEVAGLRGRVAAARIDRQPNLVPDARDGAIGPGRRPAVRAQVTARRHHTDGLARGRCLDDDDLVGAYVCEPLLAAVREADGERARLRRVAQAEVEAWILGGQVAAAG